LPWSGATFTRRSFPGQAFGSRDLVLSAQMPLQGEVTTRGTVGDQQIQELDALGANAVQTLCLGQTEGTQLAVRVPWNQVLLQRQLGGSSGIHASATSHWARRMQENPSSIRWQAWRCMSASRTPRCLLSARSHRDSSWLPCWKTAQPGSVSNRAEGGLGASGETNTQHQKMRLTIWVWVWLRSMCI
jgi:hypothetical protein